MERELALLFNVLQNLRLIRNNIDHECNIDMYNINEAIRRIENFIADIKNSEEYRKMQEGE